MIYPIPPPAYGGLENVVADLSACLGRLGHDVYVLCPGGSQPGEHYKVLTPVDASPSNPEDMAYDAVRPSLFDYDIIHSHGWAGYPYLAAREHPGRLKVLQTLHGPLQFGSKPIEKPCFVAASHAHARFLKREVGFDTRVCVPGSTRILLTDGTTTTIRALVDGQHFAEVVGIGPDGPTSTKVLAHQRIHSTQKLVRLHLADGAALEATPDHLILTTRGWTPAGNMGLQDEVVRCTLTSSETHMATPHGFADPVRIPNRGSKDIGTEARCYQPSVTAPSSEIGCPSVFTEEVERIGSNFPEGELAQEDPRRTRSSPEQTCPMGYVEGPQPRDVSLSVPDHKESGGPTGYRVGIHGRSGGWRGAHDDHSLTRTVLACSGGGQQLPGDHGVGSLPFPNADILRGTPGSPQAHGVHHETEDVPYDNRWPVNYTNRRGYSPPFDGEARPCQSDVRVLREPPTTLGQGIHRARTKDRMGSQTYKLSLSRITGIEIVEAPTYVYDLTTTTGNFVANGIVIHNCYHGIDLERHRPGGEKGDYLLFLARVAPEKGALEFVDLCREVKMPGLLVGDDIFPPDKDYIYRVMRACEETNGLVRYMGPAGQAWKVELLQEARCLVTPVQPPYIEIFGLSTVEAMATATPVLSTDLGAAKELILEGETGAVVPNTDGLVEGLARALKCSPGACRRRAEEFPRERMAREYAELYELMLAGEEW